MQVNGIHLAYVVYCNINEFQCSIFKQFLAIVTTNNFGLGSWSKYKLNINESSLPTNLGSHTFWLRFIFCPFQPYPPATRFLKSM